jgi:dihydrofolate synthase/folylpolyglutamate synthase
VTTRPESRTWEGGRSGASCASGDTGHGRPLCLLGVLADKDARGIVGALAPVVAGFIATEPDSPRALPAEALAQLVEVVTGRPCPVSPLAQLAPDRPPSQVRLSGLVVTGSLYTVGQARALLRRPGRASADSDTPPPPCSTLG